MSRATCSPLCGQFTDDPACRSCRVAVLRDESGSYSGTEKLRALLTDVQSEARFYENEVAASSDLPFSWRLLVLRDELLGAITAIQRWAEHRLDALDKKESNG
ncbi:hypothetical protein [Saccharopolyspora sp. NPDC002376]